MKRLGIFGGTFDPPHNGHVRFAEAATRELGLEKLLFVPARIPPHKKIPDDEARDRFRMVEFLVNTSSCYAASDKEFQREGPSYTIDTLHELRKDYPEAGFYLLIGGDNVASFPSWRHSEEIMTMVTIVIMKRNGQDPSHSLPATARVHILNVEEIDISSTIIRERVKGRLPIAHLVPQKVEEYIHTNKLYY